MNDITLSPGAEKVVEKTRWILRRPDCWHPGEDLAVDDYGHTAKLYDPEGAKRFSLPGAIMLAVRWADETMTDAEEEVACALASLIKADPENAALIAGLDDPADADRILHEWNCAPERRHDDVAWLLQRLDPLVPDVRDRALCHLRDGDPELDGWTDTDIAWAVGRMGLPRSAVRAARGIE